MTQENSTTRESSSTFKPAVISDTNLAKSTAPGPTIQTSKWDDGHVDSTFTTVADQFIPSELIKMGNYQFFEETQETNMAKQEELESAALIFPLSPIKTDLNFTSNSQFSNQLLQFPTLQSQYGSSMLQDSAQNQVTAQPSFQVNVAMNDEALKILGIELESKEGKIQKLKSELKQLQESNKRQTLGLQRRCTEMEGRMLRRQQERDAEQRSFRAFKELYGSTFRSEENKRAFRDKREPTMMSRKRE